jgi:hypothetical protein
MLAELQSGVHQIKKNEELRSRATKQKNIVFSYNYLPLYLKVEGGRVCF